MIEARQLVSMTDLIAQVLSQLSGSYNNILNNNLNDNLTVLTIISVLLAVLAVITGFFGMNVPLPLSNDKNALLQWRCRYRRFRRGQLMKDRDFSE